MARRRSLKIFRKGKAMFKVHSLIRARALRWVSISFFYILLVVMMIPGIVKRDKTWKVGDIPEKDLRAPYDFLVFNKGKTETEQRLAMEKVQPVYILDANVYEKLDKEITSFFEGLKDKRKKKQELPFSLSSFSLRVLNNDEKAKAVENNVRSAAELLLSRGILAAGENLPLSGKIIIKQAGTDDEHEKDVAYIIKQESIKETVDKEIFTKDKSINIVVKDILEKIVRPNLSLDEKETSGRKEEAGNTVPDQYDRIEKGERILVGGVKVTSSDMEKLQSLISSSVSRKRLSSVGGIAILALVFFIIMGTYLSKYHADIFTALRLLTLMSLIIIGVIFIARIIISSGLSAYLIPAAIAPMLIAILVEPRVAVLVAVILSVFIGVLTGYKLDYMVVSLVGGIVGIFGVSGVRRRSDLMKAGLLIGVVNVIIIIGFHLLKPLPYDQRLEVVMSGIGSGIIAAVISLGALPVLEFIFGITTDVKLLELLDINQPILERMKNEAPGTYQSSLAVANLAEAAARDVGANALLAKVGSYYHDIGKVNKASYFSENRMLAKDKHEKLNPTMSSLILISHVKEGVELAYKNKLPEVIIDIVRQHHGTTLASFFYQQAVEEDERQTLNKDTFRYPGPKPQTREAAIVMLADSVEAASRTLSDPMPGRIKNLVRKIISDKFADYQLDESNLTLRDLHQVAETCTRMLIGMFHTRVEYPMEEPQEERRNGNGEGGKSTKKNKGEPENNKTGRGRDSKE